MDIRHLKMIQEVARHGNLTKAAEHLFLSQSALSHQLKDIESFYNTQVFIRQKKQMLLTTAGKVILESGNRILEEIESSKKKILLLTEKNAGEISISTECYTSYHWLSAFLNEFTAAYPKVVININAEATTNSIKALLDNVIDIAIVEDNLNPKLNYTGLFSDEFLAIVPPGHPWEDLKWVSETDFQAENFIMYNVPTEISTIYNTLFKKGKPKKTIKMTLTEVIIQMVKAGLGVAVLPHWIVRPYVESDQVIAIPVTKKGIKRTWYAATLKNKQLPPYMNVFIRNLSKHLKKSETLFKLELN